MNSEWILTLLVAVGVFFGAGQAVRLALRRAAHSPRATVEGAWQQAMARSLAKDGQRFEANIYYFATGSVIGLGCVVAAVFSLVPVWIGGLGLFMAGFSAATVAAWLRYGSGSLSNVGRVMRDWLRR